MDVGVLEAGEERSAREVDDFGARPGQFAHLVVADRGDAAVGDGDGGGAAAGRVHGEDGAAGEDEVGGGAVHGWFRSLEVPGAGCGQTGSGTGSGAVGTAVSK